MDPLQGIFDQGFSGILSESTNKMPAYLDKLAETEVDYEPPSMDVPNIPFDKGSSLKRANELTSSTSRDRNLESKFTIEKNLVLANDEQFKTIEKTSSTMLSNGDNFDVIHTALLKKYPRETLNKFLESKIKLILDKYSFLGFENLDEKRANIVDQSKKDFKIKRSTAIDILEKFSYLDYITPDVVKQHKTMLSSTRPLFVVAKFLFSLKNLKKAFDDADTKESEFKRDIDTKTSGIRDTDNNTKKNTVIAKEAKFASILDEFKSLLYSGMKKGDINQKLAHTHGYQVWETFNTRYANDISKIEGFYNRQSFSTDFASSALEGVELRLTPKFAIKVNVKAMTDFAFDLMTNGKKLSSIKEALVRKFDKDPTEEFWKENESKLQKHYGQLGYVFIDSNIYKTCDQMKESFAKLQHTGSKLIISLKANSKCDGCSLHKEGKCEKVGLLVSNHPLIRSPRAAKRVFEKGASFLPKEYIEKFSSNISYRGGNSELISQFALGIESALQEENKNIGKVASRDRSNSTEIHQGFVPAISYGVDIFKDQNDSKIIEDVLKGD
jgi:hypothetical protein